MHIGTSSFQLTVSETTFIKYPGCLLSVFDHLAASGGPGTSQEVSTEFLRGAGKSNLLEKLISGKSTGDALKQKG